MDRTGRPLHVEDLVKLDNRLAVIDRTHDDIDTHSPYPAQTLGTVHRHYAVPQSDFKKFMTSGAPPKGTVLVQWKHLSPPELRITDDLLLIDRELIVGDIVKRKATDAMSGVVLNTTTTCTLRPTQDLRFDNGDKLVGNLFPSQPIELQVDGNSSPKLLYDIPMAELIEADEFAATNDIILYRNWVGRVHYVEEALTLKLTNNTVVELELDAIEKVEGGTENGFDVGDIVKTRKGDLRRGKWVYGAYNPDIKPIGTIVNTRVVTVNVQWLQSRPVPDGAPSPEPPEQLEADDLNSSECRIYDRTRKPTGDLSSNRTVSNATTEAMLELRVRFRDLGAACAKYDGSTHHGNVVKRERNENLGYDLNVYAIESFTTDVEVQWQDLSITKSSSIDVVPDDGGLENEHDVWPGELVQTRDQASVPGQSAHTAGLSVQRASRVGVVQNVDAADRLATVRWCIGEVEWLVDETGARTLLVNSISGAKEDSEQLSLYDLDAPAHLNVRRGDIALVSSRVPASQRNGSRTSADRDWIGEIVDTLLDGTLVVRLGDADEVRDEVFGRNEVRIIIRSDDGGNFDDGEDEEMGYDSEYDSGSMASESYDDEVAITYQDENGQILDEEEVEDEDWESDNDFNADGDVVMRNSDQDFEAPEALSTADQRTDPSLVNDKSNLAPADSPSPPVTDGRLSAAMPTADLEPYLVLSTDVPTSHAYHDQPATTANSVHLKRTNKEHRILGKPGSLPPNVFVRSWESRLDLLRVLIVGPEETPYANAPFLIDIYLPPQFPTDPPQCFFHSLVASRALGGNYRINPNLYEDGKICLSLLGTWDGDKDQMWNPAKSTILQVLVSLLGLVLVREPYFNEAGHEQFLGSPNYGRASAFYSEQALIRSCGLLLATMERRSADTGDWGGFEGVEDVVEHLYVAENGSKLLDKVVEGADALVEMSEREGGESTGGVDVGSKAETARISKGACIKLKPVIARLREVQGQGVQGS
ncbi:hypothetical protein MBLNU230_g4117t1 [Neophaeotheca triangularis]